MAGQTHTFALRPGEAKGLELRELGPRDLSLTLAVRHNGRDLGEHIVPLDGAPVLLPLDGGTLELSLLQVFLRPHLRVRFEGIDLRGSQFDPRRHQWAALLRGLALLGAVGLAVVVALWRGDFTWAARFGGVAVGVAALIPWLRRGSRPAVALGMAAGLFVAGFSLVGTPAGFEVLVTANAMAAYDLAFVFGDRQWMDELERRATAAPAPG